MKLAIKYLGLTIILGIIGFLLSNYFRELSVLQLSNVNIEPIHTKMAGQFNKHILFAFSFCLIPVLFLIVFKLTSLRSFRQKLAVYMIIILSGIIFWQYRILSVSKTIKEFNNIEIPSIFDIDSINFEVFLMIGFTVGTIISILIFRIKNRDKKH